MQYLSLRLIFLCVFLPPVLYIYSLQAGEWYFRTQWKSRLENVLISDPQALLHGRESLQEHLAQNIHRFVRELWMVKLGVQPRIWVRTGTGRYLYPIPEMDTSFDSSAQPSMSSFDLDRTARVAAQNVKLLKQDLVVGINVNIERDSWLANIVLVTYILAFSSFLIGLYVKRARQVEEQTRRYERQLDQAQSQVAAANTRLQELKAKEAAYARDVDHLKQELEEKGQQLQGTEEEALTELAELEDKLRQSETLRRTKEEELEELKEAAAQLQSKQQPGAKPKKSGNNLSKRFAVLYKNLVFDSRALDGFVSLPEEMQIKAEECIHTLNQDHQLLKVKRKVFMKKGRLPVLETEFGYRGRLYWRQEETGKIRVVTVGNKNSQEKDMKYINSLG